MRLCEDEGEGEYTTYLEDMPPRRCARGWWCARMCVCVFVFVCVCVGLRVSACDCDCDSEKV